MNKIILCFSFFLALSEWGASSLLASETPSPTVAETPTAPSALSPTATPSVSKPIILKDSDKVHDSENHRIPQPPKNGSDGNSLAVGNSEQIPREEALDNLA